MHVFDKCNVKVFRYNIQSILIMYQIDLAHISIPFVYNGFYIRPFAQFKMKISKNEMSKYSVW